MRHTWNIAAVLALSCMLMGPAEAREKKGKTSKANVPEMPWLDDKDGTRMEIVAGLVEQQLPAQALSIIADLRNDGVNKPILDLYQGQALLQQGLSSEAEGLLVAARKKMQGDARPSAQLCVLYADNGAYDEAIASCRRATHLDKKSAGAWNNYGYLLLFADDNPIDAHEALQRAVALDSTEERYRNNLGYAQVAAGEHDSALKTFMSTGTRADAAYNVAVALERFGHHEDAILYYQRAVQSQADHTLAHDALARLSQSPEDE